MAFLESPAHRLVEKLIDNVRHARISRSYLAEEFGSLIRMQDVGMPVHYHVGLVLDGGIYDFIGTLEGGLRVSDITVQRTRIVGLGMSVGTNRGPEYIHSPVVMKALDRR